MPHRLRLLTVALAAVALLAPAVPAQAATEKGPKVTVMTRNLYLGADLIPLVTAKDQQEFEQIAGTIWQTVQANDFPARAKLVAAEVKAKKPDVIGLQEAAIWRKSPDGVKDGTATPATIVVYDYIKTLQKELKAKGLSYRVVKAQDEADIEGPTSLGYDIRLTQRDAILVRKGVKSKNARAKRYKKTLIVPTKAGDVNSRRGWVAADLTLGGRTFRFVDTHLEAYGADVRTAQAKELLAKSGPLTKRLPVLMTGDFNSDPSASGPDAAAIKAVLKAGFSDAWKVANRSKKGFSCCAGVDLRDPAAKFESRIDVILARPRQPVLSAEVIGESKSDRGAGLWPSDHAGVVATFRLDK